MLFFFRQKIYQLYLRCSYRLGGYRQYSGFHFHQRFGKSLSLTFDDGPDPEATLVVSNFLKKNNIQATFFVVGEKVLENPEIIRSLDADGHLIGNHTYDHPRWENTTPELIREQLVKTEQIIDEVLKDRYPSGYPHRYFRPPYGLPWTRGGTNVGRKMLQQILDEKRLQLTLWQIDSRDWKYSTTSDIVCHVERCLSAIQGGILLFHDTCEVVVPVLEEILTLAKENNYEIVSLQTLEKQLPALNSRI